MVTNQRGVRLYEIITIIVFVMLLIGAAALAYGVKCDKEVQHCVEEKK